MPDLSPEPERLRAVGRAVAWPLLGSAGAWLLAAWLETRFDLGTLAALSIAAVALVALFGLRPRREHEWLFCVLVLVMPVAGWVHADREWVRVTVALYAGFALLSFSAAVIRRHWAMFASATIAAIIAVVIA